MIYSHQQSGFQAAEVYGVLATQISEGFMLEQTTPFMSGTLVIYIILAKTPDIIKQKEDVFNVLCINHKTTAMGIFLSC